jgi:hypothetical protein
MSDDRHPRAKVRQDGDGMLMVTTAQNGAYRTIFYTQEEAESLIEAINCARSSPLTTFAVDWGKDRNP